MLATGTWSGHVTGLNQLQAQYQKKYGPGNYIPNVFIQYWSMRAMAYLGSLVCCSRSGAAGCCSGARCATQGVPVAVGVGGDHAVPDEHRRLAIDRERAPALDRPGAEKTVNANSPSVSSTDIWISLIALVLIYIVLGAADVTLMLRYARPGLPRPTRRPRAESGASERPRAFSHLLNDAPPHHLVRDHRRLLGRLLRPGGIRLRGRRAAPGVGRTEIGRRVAINTIGPWWDGNEVWLIVAGAAHVRRVPGLVRDNVLGPLLALLLVLAALMVRGVSFEFRGKLDATMARKWSWALTIGSVLSRCCSGSRWATSYGLPIDQNHDYTGNFLDLLTGTGSMTGVNLLTLCLLQGASSWRCAPPTRPAIVPAPRAVPSG